MAGGDQPSSPSGDFTRSEVIWLLGLDREEAIDFDAVPRDSLAQSEDSMAGNAEETLFAIARWWDVHEARRRVTRNNVVAEILKLRGNHWTEHEIAKMVGVGRSTIRRRYIATVDQLLEELGERVDPPRSSTRPVCISCGERPRARLAAVEMERWTCMGRRVRPEDGKLAQAWWTPGGAVRLTRPPLARSAGPGTTADVLTTQGHVLSHELRREDSLPRTDARVRAWKVDTAAAVEGQPETWREELHPRVVAWRRVVEPEKQAGSCAECVIPQLQARVIRRAVQEARQLTEEQQDARMRQLIRQVREQSGRSGRQ